MEHRSTGGPVSSLEITFETRPSPAGDVTVLHFIGEMEHTTLPKLQEAFGQARESGAARAVLVMDQVRYMNSASVSAVLDFHLRLQEQGGSCVVVSPSENVKLVLDTLGFTDTVIAIADTIDAAIESMG